RLVLVCVHLLYSSPYKRELLTPLIVASLVFLYLVHHRRYPSRNEYHQHYVDIVQFLSKLFDTTFLSSQSQDHLKDAQFFLLFVLDLSTYRSEEHTSELQSRFDLVCRLLLEKKNNI